METVFHNSLKGLTKKEQTQAYWDRNNRIDIELKQRRDDETGTLSVVEDLNHTLSELGQRGHSYRILNKLAGQQIAMKARAKGDRRRLDLLDHIQTPGGVYGHTVEGMKLKQITVNQMEADSEANEASARAAYTHGFKEKLNNYKMEIGQLLKEKAAETDPNKIQEIEKKIQNTLVNAGVEGVGGQLQIYKNRLTTGMDTLTQGKNRILGWNDVVNPNSVDKKTVRDRIIDVLADPATDSSLKSRENRIATAFDGENITLNPDTLKLYKRINESFVAPLSTPLWTDELNYQKAIISNNLLPFNMYPDFMAKSRGLGKEQPTPPAILKRLAKAKKDLRGAFVQHFDKYGNSLEQKAEDNNPRYGFGEWTEPEKDAFVESPEYRDKVRKITDDLDDDLKKLTALEAPKVKERDNHNDLIKSLMPAPEEGPKDFMSLQKMIYDDDDGVEQRHYSVLDTYEQFKKAIWGLTFNKYKGIADIHSWPSNDVHSWFKESIAGTDNPKIKQKQIEALWDWGIYLIKRKKISTVSLDNTLSTEQMEKKINTIRKSKVPFPKEITSFIGAKKIINKSTTKKPTKSNKKLTEVQKEAEITTTDVLKKVEENEPEAIKTVKKWLKNIFGD